MLMWCSSFPRMAVSVYRACDTRVVLIASTSKSIR